MNEATIIGLVGLGTTLAGTLVGTFVGPLVTSRQQRKTLKADRIQDRRLEAYEDLLETARHLHDNAQEWAALPLAALEQPPRERLRKIDARIRVVGSDEVREAMFRVARLISQFTAALFPAQLKEQRVLEEHQADSVGAIMARLGLGGIVDEIKREIESLEQTVRDEMKP